MIGKQLPVTPKITARTSGLGVGLCRQFVGHVTICVAALALGPPVFLFPQDGTDAMDVPRHHSQRDVAFESANAIVRTAIKPMHLERVDRRLDCRVLSARP